MKKLPKLPKKLAKLKRPAAELKLRREKATEEKVAEALSNVPRITNETVAEHREEVLAGARKYIYPLQHSKHRVVRISIGLFVLVVVGFLTYCGLSLYKFQSTSSFIYGVTQVIPFPVAKAGDDWISYESYLFELRRNIHYYNTQQQTNFSTKDGKDQLKRLKQQAMKSVIQDAYVKQLAKQHNVSVNTQAVDNQVDLVRNENRLGTSDKVLNDVLGQYYGWDIEDFKRELRQQLLQQAVVAKLDTATNKQAEAALKQLQTGADFAKLATEVTDDNATKANGGQYPAPITATNRDIAPAITQSINKLNANQVSRIVNTGYTLEIIKVLEVQGNSRRAAHIQFTFEPITDYTKAVQDKNPPKQYIKV